ncbi:MAG: polysulfide reductase NrfD [Candidatus Dormibacteraeota bacterium]|nr:polysulfide reductase NrfD [Candidatus Dormibacteraeota bacterium]
MVPPATPASYYGRPVIKRPVWKWEIGAYFYTGGLAGGSMLLAAAARRQGRDTVARRALLTALAGVSVSPVLLIRDLGMPRRFYNMLRVFKVTSPMSVGTWILSGAGGFTGIAAACDVLGIMPRARDGAEVAAAALGAPLATYTAALLADTSVPVWRDAAVELPLVFAGTALATAGAASMVLNDPADSATARALAAGGALASVVGVQVMEQRLGDLAAPYHEEPWGLAAKVLNGAGAALTMLGGRRRALAVAGGAAILAGGAFERWSIFKAGVPSASDPDYTVAPQRERLEHFVGHRQAEELAPGGVS